MVVDPTSTTAKQAFTGTVDTSGVQLTSVVWTAGTNQTHSGGTTVVDYATATHISMITKGLLRDHNQSGYHKTLNDDNGNEWIKQTSTASAVNEITVANAATGTNPSITATGGDTNIDLLLRGKGTGSARFSGTHDGWVDANETWTYLSATTITVPTDATTRYSVGDKIKLTQSATVKYFYIVGVAATVLTITGGSDYTFTNNAITVNYYSKSTSPLAFPGWFNYTAAFTGFSANPASSISRFIIVGHACTVEHSEPNTGTSNATTLTISLPVTAVTIANHRWIGGAWLLTDNSATVANPGVAVVISAGTTMSISRDNTPTAFTNTGGKSAAGQITYEI